MVYVIWLMVFFVVPLCGMECVDDKKAHEDDTQHAGTAVAAYYDWETYPPLKCLCEHSHYLGYEYSCALKNLGQTGRFFYTAVQAGKIIRENRLREAIGIPKSWGWDDPVYCRVQCLDGCAPLVGKYSGKQIAFNKLGNACGWKQLFCVTCLSPERCNCDRELTSAALYRAQLDGDDNRVELIKDSKYCHWKSEPRVKVYKTCIESGILPQIIKVHHDAVKYNMKKSDWDGIYIPNGDGHQAWNGAQFTPEIDFYYKDLHVSAPFFNRYDEVVVCEMRELGTSLGNTGYHGYHRQHGNFPYSRERFLNARGAHGFRDSFFTLGDETQHPLTFMSHFPNFCNLLRDAVEKTYTKDAVTVDAVKVLSDHFGFSAAHIELLRRMIPSDILHYRFVEFSIGKRIEKKDLFAAAWCAKMGGADEAAALLEKYERATDTIFSVSKSYNIRVDRHGTLGIISYSCGWWWKYGLLRKPDIDSLAMLARYDIDAVDAYNNETKKNDSYLVFPAQHCVTGNNLPDYFTEVRTVADKPWALHLWRQNTNGPPYYAGPSEEYEMPDPIPLTPISYAIPCATLFNSRVTEKMIIEGTKNLIIIMGTLLYVLKQKGDAAGGSSRVGLPLLTDKESASGRCIEKVDDIPYGGNTLCVHIKPMHWWEHFRQPVKRVNLVDQKIDMQWQYNFGLLHPFLHNCFDCCIQSMRWMYHCVFPPIKYTLE
jgi:hypothetical protein